MNKIFILLILVGIVGIAFSQTINLRENEKGLLEYQILIADNVTCEALITPTPEENKIIIKVYPQKLLGPIQTTIGIYYEAKMYGIYSFNISFCDIKRELTFNVSRYNISSEEKSLCPSIVKVFGSLNPGKTITFDIRNEKYIRVKNSEQLVSIVDEEGNSYNIDCPSGFCKFTIPEKYQSGKLIYEIINPGCEPYVGELEVKPLGQIQISLPNNVKYGTSFFIYVFDPFKGPLKYATVKIIKPNGEIINGRTDDNGIVRDEALIRIFGKELYPDLIGLYRVQVFHPGYVQTTSEFNIEKGDCPFECCEGEKLYVDKTCAPNYYCDKQTRTCKLIELPKISIVCEPEPDIGVKSLCRIIHNNSTLKVDVVGKLRYGNEIRNVEFKEGEAIIEFNIPGKYELVVEIQGYQPGRIEGEIKGFGISLTVIIFIIIALIILIYVIAKRKEERVIKPKKIEYKVKKTVPSPLE